MRRGRPSALAGRVGAAVMIIGLLAGCGLSSGSKGGPIATTTAGTAASTTTESPSPLDSLPSFATAAEADADGRKKLAVPYVDPCPDNQSCLSQRKAFTGMDAAYFSYAEHAANDGGAAIFIYVFKDARGWHFLDAQGTQNIGAPAVGVTDQVWLTDGCANVRDAPTVTGKVLACLPNGTQVDIDRGPTYADRHLWWHLKDRGWMAHDFLVPRFIVGGTA